MQTSCQSILIVQSTRTSSNQKKRSGNFDKARLINFKKPSEPPQTSMNCCVLQSFSSMVLLWANFSLHSDTISPFVSTFVGTVSMFKLKSRKET